MIITCPSCETHFSVPDSALGARGRVLRCAKCGNKWHQQPPAKEDEIPLEMAPASMSDSPLGMATKSFGLGDDGASFSFGSSEPESAEPSQPSSPQNEDEDPFARIAELMMGSSPDAIPDVFAAPTPPKPVTRRKGTAVLWLLLVILLIGSAGAGLYFFQEQVIEQFPQAGKFYEQLGVRNEVVGAGLIFRNYNSERLVQDQNEVLIVRGVIANTTDQPREIPPLRLALYDNQKMLQDKVINPPQTSLEAKGTVGFRITLEQPDPHAGRFEVTFSKP